MNDEGLSDAGRETLRTADIDPAVRELRPDYRVLLIVAEGLSADFPTDHLLTEAQAHAERLLADTAVEDLPHVAAWREALRSFGAKPQRTRNSLEALLRRAESGLPRINRLTDVYNAISVLHGVPLGGEDLSRYASSPRLIRATGQEPFDTIASGAEVIEHPDPGEVVWSDDLGVTCRRWNWRQGRRTQLTDDTTTAVFFLDALDPFTDEQLIAVADDLVSNLSRLGPNVNTARRLITAGTDPAERN